MGGLVKFAVTILSMSMLIAVPAQATTVEVEAEIRRTLTMADDKFGGCMVSLSVSLAEEGLDCPGRWVTLRHPHKQIERLRMYDSAQLAFVTGRTVRVWVDDTKKHDNYCFVSRMDVLAGD